MTQSHYSILFSSSTGNTRLLAEAIREALPAECCDYFGDCMGNEPKSDMIYVGFWTNKGIADDNALNLLKTLLSYFIKRIKADRVAIIVALV